MNNRIMVSLLAAGLIAAAGCEADEEAFEQGADLDTPEAIENAPLTDDVGGERLDRNAGGVVATDTLQEVQLDTTP